MTWGGSAIKGRLIGELLNRLCKKASDRVWVWAKRTTLERSAELKPSEMVQWSIFVGALDSIRNADDMDTVYDQINGPSASA